MKQHHTANSRARSLWRTHLALAFLASTGLHALLFIKAPVMVAPDVSYVGTEIEVFELPPDIEVPPPPAGIARPAVPVIAQTDVSEDITITPTTFEANPVSELPPPPSNTDQNMEGDTGPAFTPHTVAPSLLNGGEVLKVLESEYPPLLRDAGIGGVLRLWVHVDTAGVVVDSRVVETSGHHQLDEAAIRVGMFMRFRPALNRDAKVAVWVQIPVTFQVR